MKFEDMPQGAILLVDKAEGWTSHDVVAKARRALGTRKVGHAGTLDPMATGLLVLGAGPATRLLTHLVGLDKTYETTIRLGAATVTDDREGDITTIADAAVVEEVAAHPERIAAGIAALTGLIEQSPSAVSAIKVDGRRAYDRVRAGEQVELKKRPVTIHTFAAQAPQLTTAALALPQPAEAAAVADAESAVTEDHAVIDVDAVVRCSSGTYIRALARDLGAGLGVGGHLTALRRTEVGPFSVVGATPNAQLAGSDTAPADAGTLLAPADVARLLFPVLELTPAEARDLANGKRLEVDPERQPAAKLVAAILPGDAAQPAERLVGLIEVKNGRTRVVTNFPASENGAAA